MHCEPEDRSSIQHGVVVRRAIDLTLDGRVSLDEGADHLCRLVHHERACLDAALRQLPSTAAAGAPHECARALLCRAVALLAASRPSASSLQADEGSCDEGSCEVAIAPSVACRCTAGPVTSTGHGA